MATVLDSPEFPGLKIYVGGAPVAGAFYSPYYSQAMTKISRQSHGSSALATAWKINTSPWNQSNCVYRKSSANCSSAVVPGPTNYNNGWVALCQGDVQGWAASLGISYPVIWVPDAMWREPGDLAPKAPVVVLKPEPKIELPGLKIKIPGIEEPDPKPVPEPQPEPQPEVDKAGYGWIFALVGVGLLIIGGVAVTRKKK